MIRFHPSSEQLDPLARLGLSVLVDQSLLAPAEGEPGPARELIPLPVGGWHPSERLEVDELERGIVPGTDAVRIDPRLLAHIGAIVTAQAERRSDRRDRHGRVFAEANALVQGGRERSPVVSALGHRFRRAVLSTLPEAARWSLAPWPNGARWAAAVTHDLDVVSGWPAFAGLRAVELLRRGELERTGQTVRAALGAMGRAPIEKAIEELLRVEADAGIVSTWFVLAGTRTLRTALRGDLTYDIHSPKVAQLLRMVRHGGHEIGLHGSFGTYHDAALLVRERRTLEEVAGVTVRGIRQHFLRLDPGVTEASMVEAGFHYDSTYGFADRSGFRLGTAGVVPVWGAAMARPLPLDEAPLIWMDRAASKYRGIESPEAWIDEAFETIDATAAVNGLWVGLWHPNLAAPFGFPGAEAAFHRLVGELGHRQPWMAALSDVVEWRRVRRSVRARWSGGGWILVHPPGAEPRWKVELERVDG